jgi:serine/threonine-protein kinase
MQSTGTSMAALPEPGTLFADKYVIESELGGGSAGVVFSATHRELRQRVAIKVLRDAGPVAAERMIREARAAIALQSEHVVRVMDVGRDHGRVFLVMEQLDGSDLGTLLKARGRLPVAEAADYVLQACAGVAEAHARGVVHRDLKPTNLFLARRADGGPLVKVVDFGISKSQDGPDAESSLTGPAEVLGSPMYMSPEQVRGAKHVDHRTDIWSLGVILFRLVTGKAPFGSGLTVSAALASVVADEPAPLREALPDAPRELEAIVRRCLAKSPGERFASVAELAAALAPLGTDEGRAAVVRLVRDRAAAPVPRRTRWPLLAACAVVLVAIPAVALRVLHSQRDATASVVATPSGSAGDVASAAAVETTASTTSALATATTIVPAPGRASAPAPSQRRPVGRPRPPGHASAVRAAATDDRY